MARETATSEMEQQKSHEPDVAANQYTSCPSNCSGSSKASLTLRTRRTRSTTPFVHCSASSVFAPKELPGDPLGSGSHLRGVGLRAGRASRPRNSIVPIVGNQEDDAGCLDESTMVDVIDYLPKEVAKTVVNMQQYYAAGVEELTGKLGGMKEELRVAKKGNEELKKRLDMHFDMLLQANLFMQSVRSDSFGGVGRADGKTLGEKRGEEEDDDDVSMRSLDMEVPPTPAVDREPVRSTGRKATRRKPGGRNYGLRRGGKGQKQTKRVSAEESAVNSKGNADAMEINQTGVSGLGKLPGEEVRPERGDNEGGAGGEDDGLRILAGAPRLQAVLRKSAWTAINNRQNDTDSDAEYRPRSPSSASASSFSPSPSPSSPSSPPPSPPPSPSPTPSRNKNTTPMKPPSSLPKSRPKSRRPRYSVPRHTTIRRYASGPKDRPFCFQRIGSTVLEIWKEYKHGSNGNHAIEFLEKTYGTEWRKSPSERELKYASNYVCVRHKIVRQVEEICEREGLSPEEACRKLGERANGRIHTFLTAVRKKEDPFEVIPKR